MKKNIIELSTVEAIILATAVLLTVSAVKKTLHCTNSKTDDPSYSAYGTSIAAVSDAILNSPAAEYVFGEKDNGTDIV